MTYSRALHAQRQLGLGSGFLGHRGDILGLGRLNGSKNVSECQFMGGRLRDILPYRTRSRYLSQRSACCRLLVTLASVR